MAVEAVQKKSVLDRFLSAVERVGNKLPDSNLLFILLALAVAVISAICAAANVSAIHPATGAEIKAWSILTKEGIRWAIKATLVNFTGFAPLGVVMVALVGTGIAEKSNFLTVFMSKILGSAPPKLVTAAIIFVSINGNMAGDSAFVFMPPLAAVVFLGLGRSPMLGMYIAFGSVAAGFCANLFINGLDFLIAPLTAQAAKFIDPAYETTAANNWYYLIVSCILLTIVGTLVAEYFLAPRFEGVDISKYNFDKSMLNLTPQQQKGLKWAIISLVLAILLIVVLCIGKEALLRDENGSLISLGSTLMAGLLVVTTFLFFVPSAVYGFVSGQYKSHRDLFNSMTEAFKDMAPYVMLCIFCGQFTAYFNKSNLGAILAIKSAELLQPVKQYPIPLLVGIVIISCIVNLFIGSSSAKWTILAPVFVPMMMILGYDPSLTQIAYRMGDSITNPLSVLFPYFPILLGIARRYEKETGVGSIVANMIPISFCFGVTWIVLLIIWVVFKLPLGPGGQLFLPNFQALLSAFHFA
ncbi:MAG: AbgT family transporter [Fusobacteriaceae bacterium]|jgi:aminobenzoyl-glutamate transport protein|nr:AbgT family transporter [Fusobacteriaceae bacterium]